jgi:hypothetical protein
LADAISNNLPAIALVLAGFCLVIMVVMQALVISALRGRVDQLTGGAGEGTLEDVLIQHLESVHAMGQDLDEMIARTAILESAARHHYARQGLVRFDSSMFPDTGGKQSFALALLDEADNGIVMTSLHSRTGTRLYAKAVVAGRTDTSLSTEEQEAIEEAMSSSRPPAPAPARPRAATAAQEGPRVAPARTAVGPAPGRTVAGQAAPAPTPTKVAPPTTVEAGPRVGAPVAAPAPPRPAPAAAPAGDDEGEPVSKPVTRPASSKGQSKGELPALDDDPDTEKTGPRPGRHTGARP